MDALLQEILYLAENIVEDDKTDDVNKREAVRLAHKIIALDEMIREHGKVPHFWRDEE